MRNDTVQKFVLTLWVMAALVGLLTGGCKLREEAPARATIGKPAPLFTLQDTEGRIWSLADLRGKVVFINFWATWCPPCRAEMPAMEALNRSLVGKPFQMLTILVNDAPEMARRFRQTLDGTFPILLPTDDTVSKRYGTTGVPETYIVDPDGILREQVIGALQWDSPTGSGMIERYLPSR